MASNIGAFKNLIARLLPKGRAWNKIRRNPILEGFVGEFCRVNDRSLELLNRELYPGTAEELLTDWETMVGIPDECTPDDQTEEERRAAVIEKLARVGSLSAEFYEQIGEFLGFEIEVTDCYQFRTGWSRVGDRLCNNSIEGDFRVGTGRVGELLAVFGWSSYFNVCIPINESSVFRVGENRVGQPLREFGNELIECTIQKLKPAHTGVTFSFKEATP